MSDADRDRHPDEEALNRIAEEGMDGVPEPIRGHVAGCLRCRREVEGIRRVLRTAGTLPKEITPGRDLWPGVEARIQPETESRAPGTWARGVRLREAAPWLVAAAAVLVVATTGTTLWLADGGDAPGPARPSTETASTTAGSAGLAPASLRGVRSAYIPLVTRLGELLEGRRDRLPPETRRVVERNLRIIDAAIAEAEAALAERPSSPELARALDRTYERKLELLRRSTHLAARL